MIYTPSSLEETSKVAAFFLHYVSHEDAPNVYGFSGDLGSGKTAFTKEVAKYLGITEHVTSPTFVIQKRYPIALAGFPFKTLIHMDAYRLESGAELDVLGFQEEAENRENLILIEWPEKVIEALPKDMPILRFSFVSSDVRTIQFPDMMAS